MIDLLKIERGSVTAPAGCGKTHLIASAVERHSDHRPVLVLTHTHAGVAALKGRLERTGVPKRAYRLGTLDGWAIRMTSIFPARSGLDLRSRPETAAQIDYDVTRAAAKKLFASGAIEGLLRANFSRLIVDEYQDCGASQHDMICEMARSLPAVVLGDPMQAIFTFAGEPPPWETVSQAFPACGALTVPWRWRNAGTEAFGRWLLDVRQRLQSGEAIDLDAAPAEVARVRLVGAGDDDRRARACRTDAPIEGGGVLIIGDSRRPQSRHDFAARTPGAVAVEATDLKDVVHFARQFVPAAPDALHQLIDFADRVMTNVGALGLKTRLAQHAGGTADRAPTEAEAVTLKFAANPTLRRAAEVLSALSQQAGTRTHRPTVLRAAIAALNACGDDPARLLGAATALRERNRVNGRRLESRSVGSTLLLKGLEAAVAVVLDADALCARNLYVAMTRGSHRLVVCSRQAVLRAPMRST